MSNGNSVTAGWINPLSFIEIINGVNYEMIFQFLCQPSTNSSTDDFKKRYSDITSKETKIFIAPAETQILQNLIWPLKHAKGSYCCENYLGTIALCGMVAEMIAILLFEVSKVTINRQVMDEKTQKGMFGSEFERLGQERRIDVLFTCGLMDSDTKGKFNLIRERRRKYLHLYSQSHDDIKKDACEVYSSATALFVKIVGQDVSNGKIKFNPLVTKYLQEKGVIRSVNEENNTDK